MNDSKYFVIQNSDGDTMISVYDNADALQKDLNEDAFGENPCFSHGVTIPANTNEWFGEILILKARVIVPHQAFRVVEWTVD